PRPVAAAVPGELQRRPEPGPREGGPRAHGAARSGRRPAAGPPPPSLVARRAARDAPRARVGGSRRRADPGTGRGAGVSAAIAVGAPADVLADLTGGRGRAAGPGCT